MYKFEKVDEALWVSAAIMIFEKVKGINNRDLKWGMDDIYFKQSMIVKKANEICTKDVNQARISTHLDAETPKSSHNYFVKRKEDSFSRLVYKGEINGVKEKPRNINEDIIINTLYGEKNIGELISFIEGEYTEVIKPLCDNEKLKKEDYIGILEFLRDHAKESYTDPEKLKDKKEKERCITLKKSAQEAIKKFKLIGDMFKKNGYKYDSNTSTWLDGTNNKVRGYMWAELKKVNCENLTSSISLFAELEPELRFMVSIEIRDNKSSENDYLRHFRYLDILDVDNTDFEYFVVRQRNIKYRLFSKEKIKELLQSVKSREESKLLIGRTLKYNDLINMSEEEINKFFTNTFQELEPYYIEAVKDDKAVEEKVDLISDNVIEFCKNQILYGPPGTGKTYNAIYRALEIIDYNKYKELIENPNKREEAVKVFNQLLEDGQISFCTFHQSYGYEDFVEGLRSNDEGGFTPKDGIFKQVCDRAINSNPVRRSKYDFDESKIRFYKMSLGEKNVDTDIYRYCIDNNCIALGWGNDIDYKSCSSIEDIKEKYINKYPNEEVNKFEMEVVKRFRVWMNIDDIVIISDGNKMAKAIGRVTGDYRYDDNSEITYKHFRDVEWLYVGDSIDVNKILLNKIFSQQSIYQLGTDDMNIEGIRSLISDNNIDEKKDKKYVLIIDEINRGNISKIFGELITLIEEDKRLGKENELKITLPYSNEKFGVPNNLYIVGTMNTADRSIALLDTALRRRFEFFEYMPKEDILPEDVDGVNLKEFLRVINARIEYLFDREHTIGHAYFIKENIDFDMLVAIMKNKVIPLIQEYFYGDFEKTILILGGAGKSGNKDYFITKEKIDTKKLFKGMPVDAFQEEYKYSIVENP